MDLKNKKKKSGFTLMEIAIAVFIVAILVAITVPIVKRQMSKVDEYSYYLAYKTVEKMAGQIVAMGDPEEINDISIAEPETKLADKMKNSVKTFIADNGNKVKMFFTTAGNKFAKSEEYIFRKMFPKAFADSVPIKNRVFEMYSSEYDALWLPIRVCSQPDNSDKYIKSQETSTDETTGLQKITYTYYKHSDFNNCIGWGKSYTNNSSEEGSSTSISKWQNLESALPEYCPSLNVISIANYIKGQETPNSENFYNAIFDANCGGSKKITRDGIEYTYTTAYMREDVEGADDDDYVDDEEVDSGGVNEDRPATPDENVGYIYQYEAYNLETSSAGSSSNPSAKPSFSAGYCNAVMGTFNMTNDSDGSFVNCVCDIDHPVMTQNNDRACCKACDDENAVPYYNASAANSAARCVCCSTDFNPVTGTCCPKNSIYVSGNTCTCISGYGPAGVCNVIESCPLGTTIDPVEKVCVVNPPVIKASRLCSMIKDYYNISSSNCNAGFTSVAAKGSTINYNQSVYDAAVGTDNSYLSIASKNGAFLNITPNIVFSNGLPMWILADKAASIPGLSYTTESASKTQNVCINLKKHSASACKNADDKAYFCKSENTCFSLEDDAITTMGDARNCCAATDLSTLAAVTQTDPTYNSDDYKKDRRSYAVSGFTVFIDINGQNKGSGTLWDDVYPFFIGANGTVYPAYPLNAPKTKNSGSNSLYLGGNSPEQLAVDVYYYESVGVARKKVVPFANVSYARGVCSARLLSKYTPYCLNIGEKYEKGSSYIDDDDSATSTNPCDTNKCYVSVRQKLRSF